MAETSTDLPEASTTVETWDKMVERLRVCVMPHGMVICLFARADVVAEAAAMQGTLRKHKEWVPCYGWGW